MDKTIYDGPDTGRFVYGEFERFMGNLEGAEHVISRFDISNNLFQIWFLILVKLFSVYLVYYSPTYIT